ncbi:DUF3052 domain-containing protein [Arenimonas sp.]|uniref:DUF3052 domain-containing protein n=1 Tax=Arenimonas sp. TaxID=1872635 RepID=UPI0039E4C2B4
MTEAKTSAYSGKSLAGKLGLKAGSRVLPIGAPGEYMAWLGDLPENVEFLSAVSSSVDIVHLFATRSDELAKQLKRLRTELGPHAALWVSWPKKASKQPTDLDENRIRDLALPLGLVDIKVCAVSEVWSGLKLVLRKELRG